MGNRYRPIWGSARRASSTNDAARVNSVVTDLAMPAVSAAIFNGPGRTANMPVKAIKMLSRIRLVSLGGSMICTIPSTLSAAVTAELRTALYHERKNWLIAGKYSVSRESSQKKIGTTVYIVRNIGHLWLSGKVVTLRCCASVWLDTRAIKSKESFKSEKACSKSLILSTRVDRDPFVDPFGKIQLGPAFVVASCPQI